MKNFHTVGIALAIAISSPAVAEVTTDFDSEGRFDVYRTYAWAKGTPAADIDQERVKRVGEEFGAAYPILLVLLLHRLQGVMLAGGTAGDLIAMTGHQNSQAWMVAIAALVYLMLVGPLTLAHGAVGAAIATTVAGLLRSLMLVTYI